jgi:hypothetical protein
MRWMSAGLYALCVLGMTGCPETYRRGGRLDRAMRQDMKEQLVPHTCSEDVWNRVCEEGDKLDEECLRECFE